MCVRVKTAVIRDEELLNAESFILVSVRKPKYIALLWGSDLFQIIILTKIHLVVFCNDLELYLYKVFWYDYFWNAKVN